MTPLNNIYGQKIVKRILLASINQGKRASTYLFYGRDGVGKWNMALAFTAVLNCENPIRDENDKISDACGQCRTCRQILNLNSPEVYFALPLPPHKNEAEAIDLTNNYLEEKRDEPYKIITAARQLTIPVNTARDIKRKTAIKPPAGVKRVVLFYQMERMLPASADSLLKLIEEPPPNTIIILTAADPDSLLPTIQSRAQKIGFKPIEITDIANYLIEKYEVAEKKAQFFARLSAGSIGQAINLATDDDEASTRQLSFIMFKGLFQKDNPSAVAIVNEYVNPNNRGELEKIIVFWQSFIGDLILLKFGGSSSEIINTDLKPEFERLNEQIGDFNDFIGISDELKNVILFLRRNVHIRPAISSCVLNLRKYLTHSA